MAKRWKKEDVAYLKRYAKRSRVANLAERFKTDVSTVQAKLHELGIEAKDSVEPNPLEGSQLLDVFQRGIKALHGGKWSNAKQLFETVVEESAVADFVNRAKRYIAICDEKLAKASKAKIDPYLEAIYERNRGNLDEALSICGAGGRRGKDDRFTYLAASIHALRDEQAEAAELLGRAIELDPRNRVHALFDQEFEELRENPEYEELFAAE